MSDGPEPAAAWRLGGTRLVLDRPRVMGIVNVTPDSFSDGGRFRDPGPALAHARDLTAAGADLLDVGGESTRPGAEPVGVQEELDRVLPVVEALKREAGVPVSVDTRRAAVAREALAVGADAVNDVSALGDPEMAGVLAASECGVALMHMRGTPETMDGLARYGDVAQEVAAELAESLRRAEAAGIDPERVALDPGLGFAKTGEQSVELVARLGVLAALGRPLLLGPSRKRFLGALVGEAEPSRRDAATVGACLAGWVRGARIFRVHEVRAVRHALDVAAAILGNGGPVERGGR